MTEGDYAITESPRRCEMHRRRHNLADVHAGVETETNLQSTGVGHRSTR
ncbi:hypothetical protein TBK1r_05050 [Stieleria magnilauensis]|uniref:Uncharacterized protein n=1 Tax=Stieleria magnilauensis TaxID=2527963 RepID=A0ABX5XLS2_9BACT|nr:hypothetical protein TBK1r_05050 [Planctomycetes bacterium TBK1r]